MKKIRKNYYHPELYSTGGEAKFNMDSLIPFLGSFAKLGAEQSGTGKISGSTIGESIGTGLGAATNFIPGVGPLLAPVLSPLLGTLGNFIGGSFDKTKKPRNRDWVSGVTTGPNVGEMASGGMVPIQAEQDETMYNNGQVQDLGVQQSHNEMSNNQTTNVVPQGNYIFPSHASAPEKKRKGKEWLEVMSSMGIPMDKFNLSTTKKYSSADLSEMIEKKFSVKDKQDSGFGAKTKELMQQNKDMYIQALAMVNELDKAQESTTPGIMASGGFAGGKGGKGGGNKEYLKKEALARFASLYIAKLPENAKEPTVSEILNAFNKATTSWKPSKSYTNSGERQEVVYEEMLNQYQKELVEKYPNQGYENYPAIQAPLGTEDPKALKYNRVHPYTHRKDIVKERTDWRATTGDFKDTSKDDVAFTTDQSGFKFEFDNNSTKNTKQYEVAIDEVFTTPDKYSTETNTVLDKLRKGNEVSQEELDKAVSEQSEFGAKKLTEIAKAVKGKKQIPGMTPEYIKTHEEKNRVKEPYKKLKDKVDSGQSLTPSEERELYSFRDGITKKEYDYVLDKSANIRLGTTETVAPISTTEVTAPVNQNINTPNPLTPPVEPEKKVIVPPSPFGDRLPGVDKLPFKQNVVSNQANDNLIRQPDNIVKQTVNPTLTETERIQQNIINNQVSDATEMGALGIESTYQNPAYVPPVKAPFSPPVSKQYVAPELNLPPNPMYDVKGLNLPPGQEYPEGIFPANNYLAKNQLREPSLQEPSEELNSSYPWENQDKMKASTMEDKPGNFNIGDPTLWAQFAGDTVALFANMRQKAPKLGRYKDSSYRALSDQLIPRYNFLDNRAGKQKAMAFDSVNDSVSNPSLRVAALTQMNAQGMDSLGSAAGQERQRVDALRRAQLEGYQRIDEANTGIDNTNLSTQTALENAQKSSMASYSQGLARNYAAVRNNNLENQLYAGIYANSYPYAGSLDEQLGMLFPKFTRKGKKTNSYGY